MIILKYAMIFKRFLTYTFVNYNLARWILYWFTVIKQCNIFVNVNYALWFWLCLISNDMYRWTEQWWMFCYIYIYKYGILSYMYNTVINMW